MQVPDDTAAAQSGTTATMDSKKRLQQQRQRVRFSDSVNVRCVQKVDHSIKTTMYNSGEELKVFKKHAKKAAFAVYDQDESKLTPCCYSYSLWEAFDSCVRAVSRNSPGVPGRVVDALEFWVSSCLPLRGLEKWVVPALCFQRTLHRRKAIRAVLLMQSKKIDGIKLQNHPEVVAKVYGRLSEPSKLYAKLIAKSDAAAAVCGAPESEDEENQPLLQNRESTDITAFNRKRERPPYVTSQCRVGFHAVTRAGSSLSSRTPFNRVCSQSLDRGVAQ